ncbi:IrmA family protein [Desulfovibrio litoralis]|uniref:Uncharacterized protein n=1 Tax=Desulfovibrio litoralis DSM 11393 TaxID=1121455 RepID=A0A1M7TPF9_9BACT|nr:IrmA family protein [Desulfovibrio litoralis]SHN72617.1 hypothetical protein SAMN02745728_02329 [Desulfovibrio litoralis DSM 11393]
MRISFVVGVLCTFLVVSNCYAIDIWHSDNGYHQGYNIYTLTLDAQDVLFEPSIEGGIEKIELFVDAYDVKDQLIYSGILNVRPFADCQATRTTIIYLETEEEVQKMLIRKASAIINDKRVDLLKTSVGLSVKESPLKDAINIVIVDQSQQIPTQNPTQNTKPKGQKNTSQTASQTPIQQNLSPQQIDDIARAMMIEGQIFGKVSVCYPILGTEPEVKAITEGYVQFYKSKYSQQILKQTLNLFQIGFAMGEQEQKKQGDRGCTQVFDQFQQMANVIGYQIPQ